MGYSLEKTTSRLVWWVWYDDGTDGGRLESMMELIEVALDEESRRV